MTRIALDGWEEDDDFFDDDEEDALSDYEAGYAHGAANMDNFYRRFWHVRWHMRFDAYRCIISARLRWKMHDFRRWLRRQKTDNPDIPF